MSQIPVVRSDLSPRDPTVPQEVETGEIRVGTEGTLKASALGSCVALALFDIECGAGGLAHIMLPGRAPRHGSFGAFRYARNATDALLEALLGLGGRPESVQAVLAGGGNVLGPGQEEVGVATAASVLECLAERGIPVRATRIRGNLRRSLTFDLDHGRILFTEGAHGPDVLWDTRSPDGEDACP